MKRISLLIVIFTLISAGSAFSLEKGALLYHSSKGDTLYGRTDDLVLPCSPIDAFYGELKSGHAGLYIGNERIIHAIKYGVIEDLSNSFITKDDLDSGCKYIGAKLPADYDDPAAWPAERKDQLVVIAREQLGKSYDFTFHLQTGNGSGDFTCVGLVEYVYEEVGYDVTPDGYYATGAGGKTYVQTYNCIVTAFQDWIGTNSFAEKAEFSRIQHPLESLAGRDYEGGKYIFFPYTQYLQTTTVAVPTDIPVSGGSVSEGGGSCFIATVSPDRFTLVNGLTVLFFLGGIALLGVYRSGRSGRNP